MKVLFIGQDSNAPGRMKAISKLDIETQAIDAKAINEIKNSKADCSVLCMDCADNASAIVKACMEAEMSIFLGQPYAATKAEAETVEAALDGYKKTVVVGHPAQFVGAYRHLRAMIMEEKLGNIGTIRMGRLRKQDAPVMPMAVGMLSTLEWMFGAIDHVYALSAKAMEIKIVVARMKSGAIAHIEMGNTEVEPYFYYEITGTGGLIEFDSRIEPELRFVDRASGTAKSVELLPQVLWDEEMKSFIDACNNTPSASIPFETGKRALRLGWAVEESAKSNKVVFV
ncbi:MAG: hypothetical protein PHX74_00700 [Candidatus Sumerlaeales bacterium]|nr:hypothetical protein [Candidatus Sumerlaeales bacterium]